jgi:anhydro-N-acetylmuramic acid kinase
MIIAGIMSGTSADGIDVAFCEIGRGRIVLIAHEHFAYPVQVRRTVLAAMDAKSIAVADLARLNFRLGELYAEAVLQSQRKHKIKKLDLIGCHGQTLYHQGKAAKYLGKPLTCTWQTGEAAIIAARTDVTVVSDFRPADMAMGGQGAPLVPYFDFMALRHPTRGRILLNLGGIANITAIPAGASMKDVLAFDTGPANMVIDACMKRLFQREFDLDGRIASRGKILTLPLQQALRHPYFKLKPPKSCGREEFGAKFVTEFIKSCGSSKKEDILATATALTAHSITLQVKQYVFNSKHKKYKDMVAAGGGTENSTLMQMLRENSTALGLNLQTTKNFGIPTDAKEAMAFAMLAYETWHKRPSNVPRATGAKCAAILGKVTYV